MELNKLANYINRLIVQTIFPYLKGIFTDSTKEIVKAIRDKEYETVNPNEISDPIVRAINEISEPKDFPTEMTIANIADAKTDLTEIIKVFKDEIKKLDKEVVVKNDLGQLLGLFKTNSDKKDLVKALERIELKIPVIKQQEIIDYTLLFSEAISKIEALKLNVDLKPLQDEIKQLSDSIKESKIFKGPIGRGGGYSSVGVKNASETRINPATQETLEDVKTGINSLFAQKVTVSGNYTYVAVAPVGTSQSSSAWQAYRVEISGNDTIITWADGNSNFDNQATDLISLNYS